MRMPRRYRNNVLMLNLTAVSLFCVLVLAGLFLYSGGSLLPATQGSDTQEAMQTWLMWCVTVTVPLITAVLWILRLSERGGD
jgi:cytochrome bd-type quinol oxidase subunit 2